MPVQEALRFIQAVRREGALQASLRALDDPSDLDQVVRIGAGAGYDFSVEELQEAFRHDWAMRWLHVNRRP
ncbi:Nif11-like leader peptide family natural product precursor [Rhodocaloribacter litoris]|uniref:Nif11-like leader peptide family natural product precursor n=1 Tax=Rhodocaloribacter litoris TaxID=2558931 RepID=UPI001421D2AE|nr:Nif11-like leader peptide family natural product precursor [Rhodocaloribacter litoris]QXD15852.1 Nif11-like leader peptide family natural product precursor [Rhodocaloribacter litoris]GIV57116.1 MAG: hypothetical protein KatS3mg042_0029 [Rhodothermaceae bacterium]